MFTKRQHGCAAVKGEESSASAGFVKYTKSSRNLHASIGARRQNSGLWQAASGSWSSGLSEDVRGANIELVWPE